MNEGTILTGEAKRLWLLGGKLRTGPHSFARKLLHWPFCSRCGLLLLKNDVTRQAARRPCTWEE